MTCAKPKIQTWKRDDAHADWIKNALSLTRKNASFDGHETSGARASPKQYDLQMS
jgi:hypothetical protein